jgi:transcriptional regulator with XRE-family HTH domain
MPHYHNARGPLLQHRIDSERPDPTTLGGRLRLIRFTKKMSQVDFCKLIKQRNVRHLRRWETNETKPPFDWIVKIAQKTGVSCDYLMTGKHKLHDE